MRQRSVAVVAEMIHTASLVHDDILDHAETRRGKVSVNAKWNPLKSTMCGNYIVGVCSKIMAQIGDPRVIIVLQLFIVNNSVIICCGHCHTRELLLCWRGLGGGYP